MDMGPLNLAMAGREPQQQIYDTTQFQQNQVVARDYGHHDDHHGYGHDDHHGGYGHDDHHGYGKGYGGHKGGHKKCQCYCDDHKY